MIYWYNRLNMELADIIKILRKKRKKIVFIVIVGFLLGVIFSFYPKKFISSGSIYVKRLTNINREYFTYEGYYAQQTAQAYTNSVVALLESPDMKKKLLQLMGIPENERNLRMIGHEISIKKTGPQIILVSVKDKNYDTSVGVWDKTVNSLIEISNNINKGGDENLGISLVSERPSTKESYRSLLLFGVVGSLVSFIFSLSLICIKEYISEK